MSETNKILITDYVHPVLIEQLSETGYSLDYDRSFDPRRLDGVLDQYYGMIINSKIKMNASRIAQATKLRFIARLGSGLDIIDLKEAKAKNISVISAPEGNCNAVAEHVIAMLLSLANNLSRGHAEVKNFIWNREYNRGFELSGKTIAIIGFGNTGQALAKKLKNWEVNIMVYDPYVCCSSIGFSELTQVDSLYAVQQHADIISLHVQLTDETQFMINYDFLKDCRKKIVLVNTSRGRVIKTADVLKALNESLIKYLALDVFEFEKPIDYPQDYHEIMLQLSRNQRVLMTPHVAGWTEESLYKISNVILDKLKTHKYL